MMLFEFAEYCSAAQNCLKLVASSVCTLVAHRESLTQRQQMTATQTLANDHSYVTVGNRAPLQG